MPARKFIAGLCAAACLAACQPSVTQDVEFLRGCWVSKDKPGGQVLGFLRLLPPAPDSKTYDGVVQMVNGNNPMEARSRFSFTRDGASVRWGAAFDRVPSGAFAGARPERPAPAGKHLVRFERADKTALLQVEGGGERLLISSTDLRNDRTFIEFEGERDGCD